MEEGCSTQPCPVLPKSGSADPSPDSLGNHFLGVQLFCDSFVTPRTVTRQAPLSMGFPRQEY